MKKRIEMITLTSKERKLHSKQKACYICVKGLVHMMIMKNIIK